LIILYFLTVFLLIYLNKIFLDKNNNVFIYLVFGLLSPSLLLIDYKFNFNSLNSQSFDKYSAIGFYFLNALYVLFLVTGSKYKIKGRNELALLCISMVLINNLLFKCFFVLGLIFYHLIDFKKLPLKFTAETILMFPLITLVMFVTNSTAFFGTQILLSLIVVKLILRNSTELHIATSYLLLSFVSVKYPEGILLYSFLTIFMILAYLKYELKVEHKEKIIDFMNDTKFISKLLVKIEISNKNLFNLKKKTFSKKSIEIIKTKNEVIAHLNDSNLAFILMLFFVSIAIFLGLYI
jgi:hypothetical protein